MRVWITLLLCLSVGHLSAQTKPQGKKKPSSKASAPMKKNAPKAQAKAKPSKATPKTVEKTATKKARSASKTAKKASSPRPEHTERTVSGVSAVPVTGGEYVAAQIVPTDLPGYGTRYERAFESGFGLFVLGEPAVSFNPQMRWKWKSRRATYWGIDGQFSLFQTGTYLHVAPALWYDFILRSSPFFTLTLGALAAPAFSRGLPQANVTFAAFGELSLAFEIDDLASVRGQFRPGIVGGSFAYAMGFLIGFQFH